MSHLRTLCALAAVGALVMCVGSVDSPRAAVDTAVCTVVPVQPTVACADTSAPSVPPNERFTAIGATTATLAWDASNDDVGVAGYRLRLNGAVAGTTTSLSHTFGGLSCGTTYTVSVTAYDAAGNESDPAYGTGHPTTQACSDTSAPSTPSGLAVSGVSQSGGTLSWSPSTDNVAVTGYRVYLGGSSVSTTTQTRYAFGGLACGTSYTVGVAAYDGAGNASGRATATLRTAACTDTSAPSVPPNERFTAIGATTATLAWDASGDDVGVAGYRLRLNGGVRGTTTSLSYTFTGLACGTTYTVSVAAYDAAGNESDPAYATGHPTTQACSDTSPPSTPSGLAVSGVSQSGGTLSWSPSTDNVAVTGYRAYLGGASVGTTSQTQYAFSGLSCGTSYTVGVDANDAAGNHSSTATTSFTTAACGASGTGSKANLWVDGNGGSCGRSATPAAYVDGQACGSFNAAYQAAKPGDLVLVQSGSYGAVSISAKASAAAPNVVIQTAPGASVSFSSLSTGDVGTNAAGAKYFSIVGPMSGNRAELQIAAHIVLDGLTLNGQGQNDNVTYLSAVDDVTLRNMDICCNLDQKLLMIDSYRGPTTNVTVDHSSFHGQQASSTSVHMECIYDNGVVGFTVRRSTFNGCKQTGDMLITQSGTAPAPSNTLIENNIWYPSTNANGATTAYSIQSVVTGSITIRNNLFLAPMVVSSNGSNYRMSGNIGYQGSCPGGVTYSHNIWVDAKCSSSDSQNSAILSPTFYVASASGNWHYKATNPAINAGDPASYPANDLDGNKRPAGTAPDAGPYEAG